MPSRVLIADDDKVVASALARALRGAGYDCVTVHDGASALRQLSDTTTRIDAAILDVNMPEIDGMSVVHRLRGAGSTTPVLILSKRTSETDTVMGLRVGADDYLPKPVRLQELLIRVGKLIDRTSGGHTSEGVWGTVVLSFDDYSLTGPNGSVRVSRTEAQLFKQLIDRQGGVVAVEKLLSAGWGTTSKSNIRSLYEHLRRMRGKLDSIGAPGSIDAVRGVGYQLARK